jgi:hypothetical protein
MLTLTDIGFATFFHGCFGDSTNAVYNQFHPTYFYWYALCVVFAAIAIIVAVQGDSNQRGKSGCSCAVGDETYVRAG